MSARPSVLVRYGGRGVRGASVLNGAGAPVDDLGNEGEFYIDIAAQVIYGPKTGGLWPTPGTFLKGNTVFSGTGVPAIGLGRDGDFYVDTATWLLYGPKANGAWPATLLSIVASGLRSVQTVSANRAVTSADFGTTLRVNATAGAITLTMNRNLGALVSTGLYSTHDVVIERSVADASSNPIIIQDDTATERARIISPVAAGFVPWLTIYADGSQVTCRGIP